MEFLVDTVAIVRHLCHHPALGREASRILGDADLGQHRIYLSAITLMEVLYLSEAKRIDIGLPELVRHIEESTNYVIVPVDGAVVLTATSIDDVPELHDRIIVATAKHLDVPVLTSDRVISHSRHVETVW